MLPGICSTIFHGAFPIMARYGMIAIPIDFGKDLQLLLYPFESIQVYLFNDRLKRVYILALNTSQPLHEHCFKVSSKHYASFFWCDPSGVAHPRPRLAEPSQEDYVDGLPHNLHHTNRGLTIAAGVVCGLGLLLICFIMFWFFHRSVSAHTLRMRSMHRPGEIPGRVSSSVGKVRSGENVPSSGCSSTNKQDAASCSCSSASSNTTNNNNST